VELGRVAISDAIGEQWGAKLALLLIGERPGLSSPDSLGAYLTYGPKPGNTDEKRNCISNIRPEGLLYEAALEKIMYYVCESMNNGWGGVHLKERERNEQIE
jgi:ethanolamine ammonia-lyase small subunit